jgi:hypothetical protein
LGAGTFGRVKQVISPSKEVLALKQLSKSHIINLKQVEHIKTRKENTHVTQSSIYLLT